MNEKTKEACALYIQGYASATRMSLWDRHGTDYFGRPDRPSLATIRKYWTPSIRVYGKQHGVIGPDGYIGHYTRKEAVAQAQAFLDKCRAMLEAEKAPS